MVFGATEYKRDLGEQEHPGRPVRGIINVMELKAPPTVGTNHHFLQPQSHVTEVTI